MPWILCWLVFVCGSFIHPQHASYYICWLSSTFILGHLPSPTLDKQLIFTMLRAKAVARDPDNARQSCIDCRSPAQPSSDKHSPLSLPLYSAPSINNDPVAHRCRDHECLPSQFGDTHVATNRNSAAMIITNSIATVKASSIRSPQPQDVWPIVRIEHCNAAFVAIGTRAYMKYLCSAIDFGTKASMAHFPPLAPIMKHNILRPPIHWVGVNSCEEAVINIFVFYRVLSNSEQRAQYEISKKFDKPLRRLLFKNITRLNTHRPSIIPHIHVPHIHVPPISLVSNNMIARAMELAADPMVKLMASNHAGTYVPKGYIISSPNPHIQSFLVEGFLDAYPWLAKSASNICENMLANPSHHPSEVGCAISLAAEAPYKKANRHVNVRRAAYLRQNFGKDLTSPNDGNVARHVYGTGCGSTTHGAPKW